ncbi:MAG: hypothetical protein M1817_003332 [Caeruleum heppii]|nr:MAG: hypothetical protein M1817_003332 [Caeruleum heppii]
MLPPDGYMASIEHLHPPLLLPQNIPLQWDSSQAAASQAIYGYPSPGQLAGIKRRREDDDLGLAISELQQDVEREEDEREEEQRHVESQGHHQGFGDMARYQTQQSASHQQHHHHRLPDPGPPAKVVRRDGGPHPMDAASGAPSVVGQEGMPPPAPPPRGPKLKFTADDDALLVDLKENRSLTWKQIAEFFPGRSSGTLQVRYCTKLKAKTTQWTDDLTRRLRNAVNEYEHDRWRIIAGKVGNGFSPAACREKAREL